MTDGKDETFEEFAKRRAPAIAKEVVDSELAGQVHEAAQEERSTSQALAIDELDELQIVEELKGRVIAQYFYEFPMGGIMVTGISWAGIKRIARELALRGEAITIESVEFESGEDDEGAWIAALALAKNLRTGEARFGYASQYRAMKLKVGGRRPDPFAKVKALNKAQRNAIRAFIPEVVITEMFKEWKKVREAKR